MYKYFLFVVTGLLMNNLPRHYENFFREHIGENGWFITLTFHEWWKWFDKGKKSVAMKNKYNVYPTHGEHQKEFVCKTFDTYLNWETNELFHTKKNKNGFRRVAFFHSGDDMNQYPHIHLIMEDFTKTKLRKPKYNDIDAYKLYTMKQWSKFDTTGITNPFGDDWFKPITYWNQLVQYGVTDETGCIDYDSIIRISK